MPRLTRTSRFFINALLGVFSAIPAAAPGTAAAADWPSSASFNAPVPQMLQPGSGWNQQAPNPNCTVFEKDGELILDDREASSGGAFVLVHRPVPASLANLETEFSIKLALKNVSGPEAFPAITVGFQDEGGGGKAIMLGWFVLPGGDCRLAFTDASSKYLVPVAELNWKDGKPRAYTVRKMKDPSGAMRVQVWIDGAAQLPEPVPYEALATASGQTGFRVGTSSPQKGEYRVSELFIGSPRGPLENGLPAAAKPVPSQDLPLQAWKIQRAPFSIQMDSGAAQSTGESNVLSVDAGSAALSPTLPARGNRSYRLVIKGQAPYAVKQIEMEVAQFTKTYPSAEQPVERVTLPLPGPQGLWESLKSLFGKGGRSFEIAHEFYQRDGNDRTRVAVEPLSGPLLLSSARLEGGGNYDAPTRLKPDTKLPPPAVADRALADARPVEATVKGMGGRSRLLFNGGKVIPFWGNGPWTYPPEVNHWNAYNAGGVSAQVVEIPQEAENNKAKVFWIGKNQFNYSVIDRKIQDYLRSNPEGKVQLQISADPYNAWGAENPGEVTLDQNGRKGIGVRHLTKWGGEPAAGQRFLPSLYSAKAREDILDMVRHFVGHVEKSDLGKVVVGYTITGFCDAQFVNWGWSPKEGSMDDYSVAGQEAFRAWLKEKYQDDVPALQKAWRNADVTFETAAIPSPKRRQAKGLWLDWQSMEDVADYNRFMAEASMNLPSSLAGEIKKLTGGKKVVVCYFASAMNSWPSGAGLEHMLRQESIDILGAPADYWIRLPGYPGGCQTMPASVLLHKKLYMTEQDWRSYSKPTEFEATDISVGRARNQGELDAMIRRESGMMIARGLGSWMLEHEAGRYTADSGPVFKETAGAFKRDLPDDQPLRADVAFFVGERSLDYLTQDKGINFRWYLLRRQRDQWDMSGVPYHLYLQSDLLHAALPDYKVYIFVSPQHLTGAERAKIQTLKSNGRTLVFLHAPGVIGAVDGARAVTDITGITVDPLPKPQKFMGEWISGGGGLTRELSGPFGDRPRRAAFGDAVIESFAFAVNDPKATPLAKYRDTGGVAFASRDFGSWRSVFCGIPRLESAFLNNIAREAGAWVAAPAGDAVFANQHIATIHAISSGKKQLQLPGPSRVTDLTSGKVLSDSTDRIEFDMAQGETRWFWLEPVLVEPN